MLARPRPWWLLLTLVPFGWTAWVGILYAGVSAGRRAWQALGVVFLALAVATWVWSDGAFIISTWIVGLGAGMLIAPAWRREVRASGRLGLEGARDRLHTRAEARRIAAGQPVLAREAGIGRPDRPGASHGGVVDVNSAPAEILARLPGVDDALASEIATAREEIDGFSSLEDLGATLRLPADAVEDLRDVTVFLPR